MTKRKKITDECLAEAVKNSISFAGVLRYLNLRQAGGSQSHYKKRAEALGLDISHFRGQAWNKGKEQTTQRRLPEDILIKRESGRREKHYLLKRAMIESGVAHECKNCGQEPHWLGNPLTLDIDHINEDWLDDRIENLCFLCPNCHSQKSRKLLAT